MKTWRVVPWFALLVAAAGALNWGAVGIFKYDIVGHLAGKATYGDLSTGTRVVFGLVGLAGLAAIPWLWSFASGGTRIGWRDSKRMGRRGYDEVSPIGDIEDEQHRRAA